MPKENSKIEVLDTSFRDGIQGDSKKPPIDEAVKIAEKLARLGFDFLELGFVGDEYSEKLLKKLQKKDLGRTNLTLFGRTRKAKEKVEETSDARKIVDLGVKTATIVAKSRLLDVEKCLLADAKTNLAMIYDTLKYLRKNKVKVIFDLEHAVDGFYGRGAFGEDLSPKEKKESKKHFLEIIRLAIQEKADSLVICDTNGKASPEEITEMFKYVVKAFPKINFGMHAHNDRGLALANTRAAVLAGAKHIQGTIDGSGERCGNTALSILIPDLELNDKINILGTDAVRQFSNLADEFALAFDRRLNVHAPYIGRYAFSTRAGMHISGEQRLEGCYAFLKPELVGNRAKIVVDGQSGRSGVIMKAERLGLKFSGEQAGDFSQKYKIQIKNGAFLESEASFELACRTMARDYKEPFIIKHYNAGTDSDGQSYAKVKIEINNKAQEFLAQGTGIFDAFFKALQLALLPSYSEIAKVRLVTYESKALNVSQGGSEALVKVSIRFSAAGREDWSIVGLSPNSLEAGLDAIRDSFYYYLLK